MPKLIDLTNRRFGRLFVVRRDSTNIAKKPRWICRCDCGSETTTNGDCLRRGVTQSCGCLQRERTGEAAKISSRKHGMSNSPEYRSWAGMKSRCPNKNATGYERWGGRGVQIYQPWIDSFETFLANMGPRPSLAHTLERKDTNGDYTPANCYWATKEEQANNRRDNITVVFNGRETTLRRAYRESGCTITLSSVTRRIQRGWTTEDALLTPWTRRGH